ncbi:MAG: hypothetical protein A7315_08370 [Candidatus Altiarchaeales archaeon WOR_SM1_79]|nr:MAG: hypothetical protein A7315_08370 [Candidatus Altiarchaeales archaeon WOR_SM1_79]
MLIDTHAHLDFKQFDKDRGAVIKSAKEAGIAVINSFVDTDQGKVKNSLELATRFDNIHTTIGLPPTELSEEVVDGRIELIKKHRNEIIGIGEVGLDYYWVREKEKHMVERENFKKFILLSDELLLPLVVHSRDAEEDIVRMLTEGSKKAVLHCFSGTAKQALDAISIGCLISVPTSIIYSKMKQKLVGELPLESIVLETDAPYLSQREMSR